MLNASAHVRLQVLLRAAALLCGSIWCLVPQPLAEISPALAGRPQNFLRPSRENLERVFGAGGVLF